MSTSPQRLLQEYHQQAQDYALSDMLRARRGVLAADVDIEMDEPHRAGLKIVVIRRGRLRCESGTGPQVELNGPSLLLAAGRDDFVLNNLFQAGEPLDYTLLQFSAAWLEQNGYHAEKVQPVDLFPRTKHCEAVLLLSKLNVERHIEVDVSMDELDVTAAESKATYNEIREHVWEHHQLRVSNLYIAQVKQKHGIIERENYNKPKSENAKQPKCPKEKEDAIVEALRHFQMI